MLFEFLISFLNSVCINCCIILFKDLLRNLAKCCIKKDVPLVEFMYLVFTHMPSESYGRWLRSVIKGSFVFQWKFWLWLRFHSLAYQFAAVHLSAALQVASAFSWSPLSAFIHSCLPPYPSYSSPSPAPLPCIPLITQSSSRCPPCFCTHLPSPQPSPLLVILTGV